MTKDELLYLAENEGEDLTEKALRILYDEYNKRGLNTAVFFTIMKNKIAIQDYVILHLQEEQYKEIIKAVWKLAIDLKKLGYSDIEIWKDLTERGVEQEQATLMIWSLQKKVKELISDSQTESYTGLAFLLLGLFVLFFGGSSFTAAPLYGGLAAFSGFLRWANGANKNSEYKKVLKVMMAEVKKAE
jgi:hypothetical protein